MKRKQTMITQRDVQEAINEFIEAGGTIVRQPDQVVFSSKVVGSSHEIYETIFQPLSGVVPIWRSQTRVS